MRTREDVRSLQLQSQNCPRQVSMRKDTHENCSDDCMAVEGKSYLKGVMGVTTLRQECTLQTPDSVR